MEIKRKNPKVSVIITIYNMEKYLQQCIESIMQQSYSNLDIVLVDDGSEDSSPALCDAYAAKDSRIQVIHKKNGGLVSAWMAGVESSIGTYLVFVDSDDWVDADMIAQLLSYTCEDCKEMICSNYIIEKKNEKIPVKQQMPPGIYDRQQIEQVLFPELLGNENRMIHSSRCMKLISKELILDNMQYCNPKVTMAEDLTIIFPAILDAERIVVVENGYYYHYRYVSESMAHHYDAKLYEKITLLYQVMSNTIAKKIDANCQNFWLTKWQKEYTFLLLLMIKNELRGPVKGVKQRIVASIEDAKAKGMILDSTAVVCGRRNQILYHILKEPSGFNVCLGKFFVSSFDFASSLRNR